jgi:hypothetical protein
MCNLPVGDCGTSCMCYTYQSPATRRLSLVWVGGFHDQPLAGGLSRAACGGGVLASAMRACCASCLPSRKAVRETAIRSVAGLSHAWSLARDPF